MLTLPSTLSDVSQKPNSENTLPLPSTSSDVSQEPNSEYTLPLPSTSNEVRQETNSENMKIFATRQEIENLDYKSTATASDMSKHSVTVEDDMDSLSQILSNYDDNESSNSDTADLGEDIQLSFKSKIQQWALQHQIRHNALNGLLEILRSIPNMDFLPKDSRSLLQTPRTNNTVAMGSGKYWYNGLRNCIIQVYSESLRQLPTNLCLTFNIDGLPIAKSSKDQFWPILCKINEKDVSPLVVAIYHGSTKPPVNEFLQPFVNELLILLKDGILIRNHVTNVKIRCFICDTPARCFVKGKRLNYIIIILAERRLLLDKGQIG